MIESIFYLGEFARMKKVLVGIVIVAAIFMALGTGAVAGGALAYMAMRTRPALAADLSVNSQQSRAVDPNVGVLIGGVAADSPADQAGIVRGDIIQSVNGQDIATVNDLVSALANLESNQAVQVTVLHGDALLDLTVTLADNQGQPYIGIHPVPDLFQNKSLNGQSDERGFMLPQSGEPGAVVVEVVENSPAAEAGLQVGDVITAVDSTELASGSSLADLIAAYAPGDEVQLTITRSGADASQELTVTLGENPDDSTKAYLGIRYQNNTGVMMPGDGSQDMPYNQFPFQMPDQGDGSMPFFGPQGLPFQLPEGVTDGAIVVEVVADSPAAEAGLQQGDIVTALDGESVSGPEALVTAVQAHKPGDQIELTVNSLSADQAKTITVTLGENPDTAGQAYLGVKIGQLQLQNMPGSDSFFGPQGASPDAPTLPFSGEGQSG
jgi:S1-C subfamily serine protease